MTQTHPPSPTTFTARGPADLVALVPVALGFQPHDSLVVLTFGGHRPFHARVDLPPSRRADIDEVTALLLGPAVRHHVRQAAFVVHAGREHWSPARRLGRSLVAAFTAAGIDVVDVLAADGSRWAPLLDGPSRGAPPEGTPYDLSTHPFSAQAVLEGRPLLGSREEVAAQLVTDEVAAARVARAAERALPAGSDEVAAAVHDHLAAGRMPDDLLAAVLLALDEASLRDAAWTQVTEADAPAHVDLWVDALRRAPGDLAAGAAAVLAHAAWVSGHGALAWCAVDRCRELDPGNSLAALVAEILQNGTSPSLWTSVRDDLACLERSRPADRPPGGDHLDGPGAA